MNVIPGMIRRCVPLAVGLLSYSALAQVPLPQTELLPVVTEAPDGTPLSVEERSTPFIASARDLSQDGYLEEEYLVSGDANIYEYVDDAARSAEAEVTSVEPYATRMLVRRPIDPSDFNGTVYVEVLNATAGFDNDAIWFFNWRYILDSGAVYVGITTKPNAADFLLNQWGSPPFPPRNRSRYANINFPEFSQVWDILSQSAALLKTPAAAQNPLRDLAVKRIILTGYSQSVGYETTYINSFHAAATMPDGSPVYDGYYLGAGSFGSKQVNPTNPPTENNPIGDRRNKVILPIPVPVIRFQTQTEQFLWFNSRVVRQTEADDPLIRFYEFPGSAHVGADEGPADPSALNRDIDSVGDDPVCAPNLSPMRVGFVQQALLRNLERWISVGANPPASRLVQIVDDGTGKSVYEFDQYDNVLGGVRMPELDVPRGTFIVPHPIAFQCTLLGGFFPLDDDTLDSLYASDLQYIRDFERAASRAVADGFLLPSDAATLVNEAREAVFGTGGGSSNGAFGIPELALLILLLGFSLRRRYRLRQ